MLAIDLSSNEKNPTGIALFEGGKIRTETVFLNEDIIKLASEHDIVGIDAPLSIPKGRKNIEDRSGPHFRECDVKLRRLGIRFFPITIGGMRSLTKRGILIKEELESMGVKVLEIFPGASLDILGIKRKNPRAVEEFLKPFKVKPRNVHESDAAIGLFTLYLWKNGMGHLLSGKDGSILIPKPTLYLGELKKGEVIRRKNRFVLETDKGEVYLRDTSALEGYLERGSTVLYSPYKGKFKGVAKLIINDRKWVMVDSKLDNELFSLYLIWKGIRRFEREIKLKNMRIDFKVGNCWIEIKGANFLKDGVALYPKPLSKRGLEHIKLLTEEECAALYIISHAPAKNVGINDEYTDLIEVVRKFLEKHEIKGLCTKALIKGYWGLKEGCNVIIP